MTANSIAAEKAANEERSRKRTAKIERQKLAEEKRANRAKEWETHRANKVKEAVDVYAAEAKAAGIFSPLYATMRQNPNKYLGFQTGNERPELKQQTGTSSWDDIGTPNPYTLKSMVNSNAKRRF